MGSSSLKDEIDLPLNAEIDLPLKAKIDLTLRAETKFRRFKDKLG